MVPSLRKVLREQTVAFAIILAYADQSCMNPPLFYYTGVMGKRINEKNRVQREFSKIPVPSATEIFEIVELRATWGGGLDLTASYCF